MITRKGVDLVGAENGLVRTEKGEYKGITANEDTLVHRRKTTSFFGRGPISYPRSSAMCCSIPPTSPLFSGDGRMKSIGASKSSRTAICSQILQTRPEGRPE